MNKEEKQAELERQYNTVGLILSAIGQKSAALIRGVVSSEQEDLQLFATAAYDLVGELTKAVGKAVELRKELENPLIIT